MKLPLAPLFSLVLTLLLAVPAPAGDRIVLKDGQILTGKILAENATEIRIAVDGAKDPFVLPRSVIAEVEREATAEKAVEKPAEKPATGPAVVRLRQGGKQIEGVIVNEDSVSLTLRVGDREYTFDKSRVEWVRQGGKTRRFAAAPAAEENPRDGPRGERGPSAELRAWLELCVKHLGSEDPAVVRSAAGALMGAGPAGRPALERAAKSDDPRVAETARRILERGAGGGERDRRGRGGFLQRALSQLELTPEQTRTVRPIVAEHDEVMAGIRGALRSGEVDREGIRERYQEANRILREKLEAVLTEKQRAKLTELLTPRRR